MTTYFSAIQMAMSLAFHIVFAAIVLHTALMIIAEWKCFEPKTRLSGISETLGQGNGNTFAVGAVSGTYSHSSWDCCGLASCATQRDYRYAVLARRICLLHRALFLGIYLYGWNRVPPRAHLFAGAMVAISGALSGIFRRHR